MVKITGRSLIAGIASGAGDPFHAIDQASGRALDPPFHAASKSDVEAACRAAADAASEFAADRERRAHLLETIAEELLLLGDALLDRASAESGLPLARLTGERGRTIGQLRLFAAEVRDGGWLGLRIDPALPDRAPLPRPDLRMRKIPLGPVAVFGASNFPLAFSVAGGDTAAAFAAGCPVVVKGHPAHPGTSDLVAGAIARAVAKVGLPPGVFSHLIGPSNDLGAALVADPHIKAVGFTGSRAGGLALVQIAAQRDVPIPVYAEMSSVNPVTLFPRALAARAEGLGSAFVASLTMGAGQFCTNPGLVLAISGDGLDRFMVTASSAIGQAVPQTMLTAGIHRSYEDGIARLAAMPRVETIARGLQSEGGQCGQAAMFAVDALDFLADENIADEVFGASSLVVRCADEVELLQVLASLGGQLTATLHFDGGDLPMVTRLLPVIEAKAGRILANGWPTGVEVAHAMVHGGPYPATSDGRSTSVGTLAIDRFLRPVCYQDLPDALLPAELRGEGEAAVPRRVDGALIAGSR